MPRQIYVFDPPDRFVAGAIGQPGERQFYLQARKGALLATVALEKSQVAVLAERLGSLISEVRRRGLERTAVEPRRDLGLLIADPHRLEGPIRELFRVGTITLSWDGEDGVVVVEARAQQADDDDDDEPLEVADDDEDGPDLIRVKLPARSAETFAERALQVVSSGRPPCPLCGMPLNPEGHICPRRNGTLVH